MNWYSLYESATSERTREYILEKASEYDREQYLLILKRFFPSQYLMYCEHSGELEASDRGMLRCKECGAEIVLTGFAPTIAL